MNINKNEITEVKDYTYLKFIVFTSGAFLGYIGIKLFI